MPTVAKRHANDPEAARIERNRVRKNNYMQTRVCSMSRPWLSCEDEAVITRTVHGMTDLTDRQLSVELHRSVQAIQIQRSRLKKGSR